MSPLERASHSESALRLWLIFCCDMSTSIRRQRGSALARRVVRAARCAPSLFEHAFELWRDPLRVQGEGLFEIDERAFGVTGCLERLGAQQQQLAALRVQLARLECARELLDRQRRSARE